MNRRASSTGSVSPRVSSTYVPSGDSKGLLEALNATSPRRSPSPRKPITVGSTKPRKSVKTSTKGKSNDEATGERTQEAEKQGKPKRSVSRKSIKVADTGEKETQGMTLAMTFLTFACTYHLICSRTEK